MSFNEDFKEAFSDNMAKVAGKRMELAEKIIAFRQKVFKYIVVVIVLAILGTMLWIVYKMF